MVRVILVALALSVAVAGWAADIRLDGIIMEGTTSDEYETTITLTDPTADQTATLPNATGTVVLASYGEMHIDPNSTAWTLTGQGVYYPNTDMLTGEVSGAGYVTYLADPNNGDALEIGANGAGVYQVNASMSFTGVNSQEYECALFVEGVEDNHCEFYRTMGAAAAVGVAAFTCITTLAVDDTLTFRCQCESGNGHTMTISEGNFNIHRIGF